MLFLNFFQYVDLNGQAQKRLIQINIMISILWFRWKQYFEEEDCRCWQKIPITSGLFKKTEYTEIEKKIHNVTGLVTNVAVNTKSI